MTPNCHFLSGVWYKRKTFTLPPSGGGHIFCSRESIRKFPADLTCPSYVDIQIFKNLHVDTFIIFSKDMLVFLYMSTCFFLYVNMYFYPFNLSTCLINIWILSIARLRRTPMVSSRRERNKQITKNKNPKRFHDVGRFVLQIMIFCEGVKLRAYGFPNALTCVNRCMH